MKQISLKYIWIWADPGPNLPDLVQTPVSYLSSKTGGQHPARNVSEQSRMHISWLLNLMQNTQKDNDLKNQISLKCHLQISENLLCWLVRDLLYNNWLNKPHSRMQSLARPPDLQPWTTWTSQQPARPADKRWQGVAPSGSCGLLNATIIQYPCLLSGSLSLGKFIQLALGGTHTTTLAPALEMRKEQL